MTVQLMMGDCLERMAEIPAGSVDAVICDPPYGTVAGMGGDIEKYARLSKAEWDVAIDPAKIMEQCNRVLRMNGALVLFSQEPYTSRLITEAHGNIPFSYRMTWLKDHFANALLANKAPVSYTEDVLVFFKKYDTLGQHPLREYAIRLFSFIGKDKRTLFQEMGHQGVCHFMRFESQQFTICTEATYNQLCALYVIDKEDWFVPYSELEAINRRFNRSFNIPDGSKFKSNVLQYKKDYTGLHPTQKPVALMGDLVRTYTNEGDTVLDFTMGSGSTGVACLENGRDFIGIERDPGYFEIARKRMELPPILEIAA